MKRTGYLHDNRYLLHDTGPYHPETADRLTAVYNGIKDAGLLDHLTLLSAVRAEFKWIETVHDPNYIHRFEEVCLSGNRTFDYPDNQMCVDTYETAFLAVGGVLDVARRIMEGELDNAFCAVRPPGHHAEYNQAMGFCYFNNVAIAARYLQTEFGARLARRDPRRFLFVGATVNVHTGSRNEASPLYRRDLTWAVYAGVIFAFWQSEEPAPD